MKEVQYIIINRRCAKFTLHSLDSEKYNSDEHHMPFGGGVSKMKMEIYSNEPCVLHSRVFLLKTFRKDKEFGIDFIG